MKKKRITLAAVRNQLRAVGMGITSSDGEYRVTPHLKTLEEEGLSKSPERQEAMAYYTNELNDALQTGREMRRRLH